VSKPTKFDYKGEWVDAVELEFEVKQGGLLIVQLEDGTSLRLSVTPTKIVRVNAYNDAGEPIYQLRWGSNIAASVPVELLRPPTPKKKD